MSSSKGTLRGERERTGPGVGWEACHVLEQVSRRAESGLASFPYSLKGPARARYTTTAAGRDRIGSSRPCLFDIVNVAQRT